MVVSGALGRLTGGNKSVVVAGIVGLVACGYVVSVVSGRGSRVVVVAGIEVVTTTSGTG
jgi:hypothetical protein